VSSFALHGPVFTLTPARHLRQASSIGPKASDLEHGHRTREGLGQLNAPGLGYGSAGQNAPESGTDHHNKMARPRLGSDRRGPSDFGSAAQRLHSAFAAFSLTSARTFSFSFRRGSMGGPTINSSLAMTRQFSTSSKTSCPPSVRQIQIGTRRKKAIAIYCPQ
jgi:hypothetical protein